MSDRSDVLNLINGRPVEKLPWFGDLSYYYDSLLRRNLLEEKYKGPEGEKHFYYDSGVGIYLYTPDVFIVEYSDKVKYSDIRTPNRITLRFDTPIGSIESIQNYSNDMYCYAYSKHFVKNIDDFRVMKYVHENSIYKKNYEEYAFYDNLWDEDGIGFAMGVASMAPLQKLLSRWAGIETTIQLFMDFPDEFESVFKAIEESQKELVKVLAASPAEVVILPENLSSEVVGDYFFRHFNMPYYKQITDEIHRAGKKVAIHIDGSLKPCLGLLSDCGFDIAEAVTPEPFGDVALEDVRKTAGDNIIIWGGLPGGLFSRNYGEELFEEHVLKLIKIAKADGKFVIGVADQVPPDAVPERIGRVRELVNEFGSYIRHESKN